MKKFTTNYMKMKKLRKKKKNTTDTTSGRPIVYESITKNALVQDDYSSLEMETGSITSPAKGNESPAVYECVTISDTDARTRKPGRISYYDYSSLEVGDKPDLESSNMPTADIEDETPSDYYNVPAK